MAACEEQDHLSPEEVESCVLGIRKSSIMELGSLKWLKLHDRCKRVALQSVAQVLAKEEETVKECLVRYQKLPIVVHELIAIEFWRESILPEIVQRKVKHPFVIYPVLFYESICLNLLETILFHPESKETLGEVVLDLVDYCLRSLNGILAKHKEKKDKDDDQSCMKNDEGGNDVKEQSEMLLWGTSVKAMTALRFIIANIQNLRSEQLVSRLVVTADTPMMLTELILVKPWRRDNASEGRTEDFDPVSSTWKPVDASAKNVINPETELQIWLALRMLLQDGTIISAYECNESRKNSLLRLRKFLNDRAFEEFPFLKEVSVFLDQLAVTSGSSGPSVTSELSPLLKMVPPIRRSLEEEFKKNKKKILDCNIGEFIHGSDEVIREKATMLAQAFDFEQFKTALPIWKHCARSRCSQEAIRKCAKCKKVSYCTRKCQTDDWKAHKFNCRGN